MQNCDYIHSSDQQDIIQMDKLINTHNGKSESVIDARIIRINNSL